MNGPRSAELRGSAKPPNLTEPSSSAEPEPERFGRSLNALQAVKKHVITLPMSQENGVLYKEEKHFFDNSLKIDFLYHGQAVRGSTIFFEMYGFQL